MCTSEYLLNAGQHPRALGSLSYVWKRKSAPQPCWPSLPSGRCCPWSPGVPGHPVGTWPRNCIPASQLPDRMCTPRPCQQLTSHCCLGHVFVPIPPVPSLGLSVHSSLQGASGPILIAKFCNLEAAYSPAPLTHLPAVTCAPTAGPAWEPFLWLRMDLSTAACDLLGGHCRSRSLWAAHLEVSGLPSPPSTSTCSFLSGQEPDGSQQQCSHQNQTDIPCDSE